MTSRDLAVAMTSLHLRQHGFTQPLLVTDEEYAARVPTGGQGEGEGFGAGWEPGRGGGGADWLPLLVTDEECAARVPTGASCCSVNCRASSRDVVLVGPAWG